jgi:hypothetical protein
MTRTNAPETEPYCPTCTRYRLTVIVVINGDRLGLCRECVALFVSAHARATRAPGPRRTK